MADEENVKLKIGNGRLDDLLYGGVPAGSTILVQGPAFSGIDTMARNFLIEGLKSGIPAIYVLAGGNVSDEIKAIKAQDMDAYKAIRENKVTFIEIFSKYLGIAKELPNTQYIEDPTNLNNIMTVISQAHRKLADNPGGFRLALNSISTIRLYHSGAPLLQFLHRLTRLTRHSNGTGMHVYLRPDFDTAQEGKDMLQLYNGMFETRFEETGISIRAEGNYEVRSRAWIQCEKSPNGLMPKGAFSVDAIE